jgi:phage gp37-like protein
MQVVHASRWVVVVQVVVYMLMRALPATQHHRCKSMTDGSDGSNLLRTAKAQAVLHPQSHEVTAALYLAPMVQVKPEKRSVQDPGICA